MQAVYTEDVDEFETVDRQELRDVFSSNGMSSALENPTLLRTYFREWGTKVEAMRALGLVPLRVGTYEAYLDSLIWRYGSLRVESLCKPNPFDSMSDEEEKVLNATSFCFMAQLDLIPKLHNPATRLAYAEEQLRPVFRQMDDRNSKFLAWWRRPDIQACRLSLELYLLQDEQFKLNFQYLHLQMDRAGVSRRVGTVGEYLGALEGAK